jgi:hypothetical protein
MERALFYPIGGPSEAANVFVTLALTSEKNLQVLSNPSRCSCAVASVSSYLPLYSDPVCLFCVSQSYHLERQTVYPSLYISCACVCPSCLCHPSSREILLLLRLRRHRSIEVVEICLYTSNMRLFTLLSRLVTVLDVRSSGVFDVSRCARD